MSTKVLQPIIGIILNSMPKSLHLVDQNLQLPSILRIILTMELNYKEYTEIKNSRVIETIEDFLHARPLRWKSCNVY